ncbi:MAG: DNA mismatch repair protein MutS [Eubacterium sp.]|nr:DNA mismatch repair protein MutS [Eubacterium sp.]
MNDELLKQKSDIELEKIKLDKLFSIIAALRLVVFIAAAIFILTGASKGNTPFLIVGIICAFIFIYLVKYHADIDDKLLTLKTKSNVIKRYVMRNSGEWKKFEDNGSEFLTKEDTLSYDLDILGRSSLFQLICVAHTDEGRKRLANTLSLKNLDIDAVSERYEAISELTQKADFMIDFESTSERIVERRKKDNERRMELSVNDEDKQESDKEEKKIDDTFPLIFYPLMILVPVMNIVAIVMVLGNGINPARILATFILGLVITWWPKAVQDKLIAPVYQYGNTAKDYHKMLKLLAEVKFDSKMLSEINERVASKDGLLKAIKDLGKIGVFNNFSFNPLIHMVLAGFTGWDYYIALAASRWSKKNKGVFEECIDIIGRIEELESIAVLGLVRETVKPVINCETSDLKLSMKSVYHPLLDPETVIANDAELDGDLTVITGSNMSGKTTFMRTVAINMVLGFIGSGVCAESFEVPYVKLFTSMRVMDDVSGGISTFYAEILRIKEMAEYVSSDPEIPALCLIDEIFKGTNSADRIVGSEKALKKLAAGNAMVIVTTHDFELCDLTTEDGKPVDNYHFEEQYENGALKFDYKMRNGRCTTRNAMAILKMAGLVQS